MILFIISCGNKKISPSINNANLYYKKYIDLSLKGEKQSADTLFDKTVVNFTKLDKMCSLSRVYITKYIIDLPKKDFRTLNVANEFATSDNCSTEKNIIAFLLGQQFDVKKLEEPFKTYAEYYLTKNINILIKASENENLPDYAKSRLLKFTASELIQKDLEQAQNLITKAKEIDTFNGWTYSIYQDLQLMKKICLKSNKDCQSIDKRIELIKNILLNK